MPGISTKLTEQITRRYKKIFNIKDLVVSKNIFHRDLDGQF